MIRNFFALLSIIFFVLIFQKIALGAEELVKYRMLYLTNPATGLRYPDGSREARFGIEGEQVFKIPIGAVGSNLNSIAPDPNSPIIGYTDDCYPDDLNNPVGNIVISGRLISNFNNKPINGAVVAIHMGAEQQGNISDSGFAFQEKFIHGGKDWQGKLTNLYTFDISKDGYYKVYACNAYKQLSEQRKDVLKKYSPNIFNNPAEPCNMDGYSGNTTECTHFDFTKIYPKFTLSVICGLKNSPISNEPSPVLGEVLSIDNYNQEYKSANPPSFMFKNNLDLRINCSDDIGAFPIPKNLQFDAPLNVASCRLDDISPNLKNYYSKVQLPLKNDFYSLENYTYPGSTLIPDETSLADCTNPDDPLCLKNFITKAFPKPTQGINVFDYKNKNYLDDATANPNLLDKSFTYVTAQIGINSDLSDKEYPGVNDWIAQSREGNGATQGQLDTQLALKSFVSDYKFDLNVLKELYGCFTTFNAPAVRSSAFLDEQSREKFANNTADLTKEFYQNNLRIPSCRELYCGSDFVPDNTICKVKRPDVAEREKFGFDFSLKKDTDGYYQINALSGYGPGVTLNFRSLEDISGELMILSKDLINSEFNPKKSIPGATLLYKPVNKVSDIVACLDDNNNPVYLNDGSVQKEGSITYRYENQEKTFFSPVPFISFLSVPYTMELFQSIEGDNYQNYQKSDPSRSLLFPEQCNEDNVNMADKKHQLFANCKKAVIPGGVYSISALKVIANYCSEVIKIPTPDSANLPKAAPLTSVKEDSRRNLALNKTSLEVDLSIAKIGTPLSLCLCSTNDKDCSLFSSLNNKKNAPDYAVASFVGTANQFVKDSGESVNVLGFTCANSYPEPQNVPFNQDGKTPLKNCQNEITNVDRWEIPNTSAFNFVGGNSNLRVMWKFSMNEINSDMAHEYLTYKWGGAEPPKAIGTYRTNDSGSWETTTLTNEYGSGTVACKEGGYVDGELVCLNPSNQPPHGIGLDRVPEQVSSIRNIDLSLENGITEISGRTLLTPEEEDEDNVRREIKIIQKTEVGNSGSKQSRFKIRNAKYDPIPELLNDFRRYSVMGAMAGDYCKTPKINSIVNISTSTFNSNNTDGFQDPLYNFTAGAHCNTAIPEELDRCEDIANIPQPWIEDANNRGIEVKTYCRSMRCLSYCHQVSGSTYESVGIYARRNSLDPSRSDFFCKNLSPLRGVEFQVNPGDEGCVLDLVNRIKQGYANPAELDYDYKSVTTDSRYNRENYPVFDNNLCVNPSFEDPYRPGYQFDANNCKRNVYDAARSFEEFKGTGREIDLNINP